MRKKELLNKIKLSIHQLDSDAEIYLYGSRARGDNKKNSVWDLLILVDQSKITNLIEDRFREYLYDIELEIGQIISVLIYPKFYWNNNLKHSPLYKNVIHDGIRL
ncbi:MAG TPA: nucleotidyltransferase domain-containing protein [Bacteroidales bacterium]|nr:nucleotidyltransferase domain-containing protein [Bacteroidales bacterium]